jgi:hypothetical protein
VSRIILEEVRKIPTLVPIKVGVVLGCDDSTSTRSLKNMRDARSSARRGDNDGIDELTACPKESLVDLVSQREKAGTHLK